MALLVSPRNCSFWEASESREEEHARRTQESSLMAKWTIVASLGLKCRGCWRIPKKSRTQLNFYLNRIYHFWYCWDILFGGHCPMCGRMFVVSLTATCTMTVVPVLHNCVTRWCPGYKTTWDVNHGCGSARKVYQAGYNGREGGSYGLCQTREGGSFLSQSGWTEEMWNVLGLDSQDGVVAEKDGNQMWRTVEKT